MDEHAMLAFELEGMHDRIRKAYPTETRTAFVLLQEIYHHRDMSRTYRPPLQRRKHRPLESKLVA